MKEGFTFQIPEDFSDESAREIKSRLEGFDRSQLEMLIIILSWEILQLKHQLDTSLQVDQKNNVTNNNNQNKKQHSLFSSNQDNVFTKSGSNCSNCHQLLQLIPVFTQIQKMNLTDIKTLKEHNIIAHISSNEKCDKDINSNYDISNVNINKESTTINNGEYVPFVLTNQIPADQDDHTSMALPDQNSIFVYKTINTDIHNGSLSSCSKKSGMGGMTNGTRAESDVKKKQLLIDLISQDSKLSLQDQMAYQVKDHQDSSSIESLKSVVSIKSDSPEGSFHDKTITDLPERPTSAASKKLQLNYKHNTQKLPKKLSSKFDTSKLSLKTADEHVYSCYKCKVEFESKMVLSQHIKNKHITGLCSCSICGKSFMYKHNFKIHQKNKHNCTTVLCSYCGKLVLQTRLETHMEKVHEKPLYTCHICQKGFLKRECLEGHINKHSNTKPYICECCGRKYAYSTSLYSHKKQCIRASLPAHLQHLQSLDNKNSSYVCEICGVKFEGISGLKDHINAKHCNKPHVCIFCSKEFQWRPSYNRHVKKCKDRTDIERERSRQLLNQKSVDKRFVCSCGKQYLYKQSYRRHEKYCLQMKKC